MDSVDYSTFARDGLVRLLNGLARTDSSIRPEVESMLALDRYRDGRTMPALQGMRGHKNCIVNYAYVSRKKAVPK